MEGSRSLRRCLDSRDNRGGLEGLLLPKRASVSPGTDIDSEVVRWLIEVEGSCVCFLWSPWHRNSNSISAKENENASSLGLSERTTM